MDRRRSSSRLTAVMLAGGVAVSFVLLHMSVMLLADSTTGPLFRSRADGRYFDFRSVPNVRTKGGLDAALGKEFFGKESDDDEDILQAKGHKKNAKKQKVKAKPEEEEDSETSDSTDTDSASSAHSTHKTVHTKNTDDEEDDDEDSGSTSVPPATPAPEGVELDFLEYTDFRIDKTSDDSSESSEESYSDSSSSSSSSIIWDEAPTEVKHLKNAAVVVLTYNRPDFLKRTLKRIQSAELSSQIKLYVSVDGTDPDTVEYLEGAAEKYEFTHLTNPRKTIPPLQKEHNGQVTPTKAPSTMYLAAHYKWVLNEVLIKRGHSHAILIEDDMLISKDFFSLFEQTAPLLDMDPTLMCVSSWNDNGFKHLNLPKDKLFRTGFFPGLGWMLKRELWENELSKVFPRDQWDHFMRVHSTSKGRECVVPYLSRNKNIGISGSTSNANFFKTYLQDVASYEGGGAIAFGDLSYLLFRNYEKGVQKLVKKATIMLSSDIYFAEEGEPDPSWMGADKVVLIPYLREQYDRLSKKMRIYHTPRSFHQYTLLLRYRGVQVILADKRLSPFLPKKKASKPISGLRVVPAPSVGKSCNDVCESLEGGWDCAKTQFDFINQCRVLQKVFKGCADGCRKEWGKDIPNREHLGAEENAFGGRQCLVTEEIPTCEARHPKTQRICPCTPRGGGEAKRSGSLEIRAATERDLSCHDVCTGLGPGYTCDETQFHYVNTCSVLKQHFPCKSCAANQGKDIPNYVVEENDANFGTCLTQRSAPTCAGQHKSTKRLCPCVKS